jgi:plastocyanin
MDTTTHTNTADKGEWNTGDIDAGASATFTAPSKPGTYGFHCNIHNFMTGTLTVAA